MAKATMDFNAIGVSGMTSELGCVIAAAAVAVWA
jgi:hypothetical protein